MSPARRPDGPPATKRLVTYDVDPAETAVVAIDFAFRTIGVEVHDRDATVHDHVPADAIDALFSHDAAFRLQFVLWEHPVVLTDESVRIHAAPGQ
jgi:hypothetical protein